MGKKKDKGQGEAKDTTMWMVTFGDLLMLLLTFFVMLLTMSSMDAKTLKTVFSIFEGGVGVMEFSDLGSIKAVDKKGSLVNLKAADLDAIKALNNHLDKLITSQPPAKITHRGMLANLFGAKNGTTGTAVLAELGNLLDISEDKRGVVLSIEAEVLFGSGETQVRSDVLPLLDTIAKIIKRISNDALVLGHADNVPVRTGADRSNWDLSLYRALNVRKYLVQNGSVPSDRVFAGGYGDVRPKYSNKTKDGRRKNRRVEIVLKRT